MFLSSMVRRPLVGGSQQDADAPFRKHTLNYCFVHLIFVVSEQTGVSVLPLVGRTFLSDHIPKTK